MDTHSPGPWRVGNDGRTVYAADGFAVASATVWTSCRPPGELDANARLMAASPDMLGALQFVARWCEVNQRDKSILMKTIAPVISKVKS